MLRRLRDFIAHHIVATVPDEMDLCLSCKRPTCTAPEYRRCRRRLDRLAWLRAARAASAGAAHDPGPAARPPRPAA